MIPYLSVDMGVGCVEGGLCIGPEKKQKKSVYQSLFKVQVGSV